MNKSSRMIVISAIIAVVVIIAATTAFVLFQNKGKETGGSDSTPVSDTTAATTIPSLSQGTTVAAPPKDEIQFVFAERLQGELVPLVPADAVVNVDPKGERKAVTINFPTTIPDAEVKAALEKIQPIAEKTYKDKGIITEVGRRTPDNVAVAAQPTAMFLPVHKMTEQWDVINAAGPKVKGLFEFVLLSPEGVTLHDFEVHDAKACTDKVRKVNSSLKEEDLIVGESAMVMRFPKCGSRHLVVYGKTGQFEQKLDTVANVMDAPDLIPVDSVVVVENDGTLVVETQGPPPKTLEDDIRKIWDLESVIVQQAK